jgi:hypothetical protein
MDHTRSHHGLGGIGRSMGLRVQVVRVVVAVVVPCSLRLWRDRDTFQETEDCPLYR